MKTIKYLLQKEFLQIFRDKGILRIILVIPVVQLLLLPLAANYEVKNINLSVVDHDHSTYSRALISKVTASGYFRLQGYNASFKEAFSAIEADRSDLILEIPAGFERNLTREGGQKVFIAVNAINGVKAGLGGTYLANIIRSFNGDVIPTQVGIWPTNPSPQSEANVIPTKVGTLSTPTQTAIEAPTTDYRSPTNPSPSIQLSTANRFNPLLNYNLYMVPGILAFLVTMIGGFLCALNIVKEKEIGTIEQINVTPIRKHHFILGKLIPFWVIGLVVFSLGLLLARLVYGIVPVGSLGLLYGFVAVYLLAVLGFGLLVSTFADTQQQAMFIAFFFVMIFILMGGLFTSIDSMPPWAQIIAAFNPVSYMIDVMRMIVLKGSGFIDIKFHLLKIVGFAVVLNSWAILNYRKTT